MPDRHFYLLRHHILFYITFLDFCLLAPDEIRILCGKNKGFLQKKCVNPLGFNFQNYNFDHDKKLCRVMDDPNCISVAFELNLNIKKYGETIAEKILQKFLENYDLEESQLKHDFKKYIKALFHSIFREISKFESIPLTYGKLFKKVRKIILKKLGITEQVNPH